jgi:hypothetical protein
MQMKLLGIANVDFVVMGQQRVVPLLAMVALWVRGGTAPNLS